MSTSEKEQIFCAWRRKYVRLTPEERVRQTFLHGLVEQLHYPASLVAVETAITVAGTTKRCDAVVYNQALQPVCIIEFKAPSVPLTQAVFDQVAVYNHRLQVQHFMLSNSIQHVACRVDNDGYHLLDHIPTYQELCQN